jgi:hypothetical protein
MDGVVDWPRGADDPSWKSALRGDTTATYHSKVAAYLPYLCMSPRIAGLRICQPVHTHFFAFRRRRICRVTTPDRVRGGHFDRFGVQDTGNKQHDTCSGDRGGHSLAHHVTTCRPTSSSLRSRVDARKACNTTTSSFSPSSLIILRSISDISGH